MMSTNKTRGFPYSVARLLGDVNAAKKGKIGRDEPVDTTTTAP